MTFHLWIWILNYSFRIRNTLQKYSFLKWVCNCKLKILSFTPFFPRRPCRHKIAKIIRRNIAFGTYLLAQPHLRKKLFLPPLSQRKIIAQGLLGQQKILFGRQLVCPHLPLALPTEDSSFDRLCQSQNREIEKPKLILPSSNWLQGYNILRHWVQILWLLFPKPKDKYRYLKKIPRRPLLLWSSGRMLGL